MPDAISGFTNLEPLPETLDDLVPA